MSLRRRTLLVATMLLVAAGSPAWGQPATDLPADRLLTPPGPGTVVAVETGALLGHRGVSFAVRLGGLAGPLVVRNELTNEVVAAPVEHALVLELAGAVGLWGWLQVGLARPLTLSQEGDRLQGVADDQGLVRSAGGDTRIHLTARILDRPVGAGRLRVALAPFVGVPTGDADHYAGVGGFWGEVRMAASFEVAGAIMAAQGGLRLRPETTFYGSRQRTAAAAVGLGGSYTLPFRWCGGRAAIVGEVEGEAYSAAGPWEARSGVRVRVWQGVWVAAAGGAGLGRALGAPRWRALMELRVGPWPE